MKNKSFLLIFLVIFNLFSEVLNLQGADAFDGVTLAKGYKDLKNHNPCYTQKFSADPGVMIYNDRVYIYATNDGHLQAKKPVINNYDIIETLNIFSSADLVNWADHGTITVAGEISKWAGNSWAPYAVHKTIGGKEKFFLYFANNINGIGVLTSDSPTGPFTDPLGHALISRKTANSNVHWLFDPAVLIDDDGTAYMYYGGGVPFGEDANPETARVVQLGADMISIVGTPVNIDPPYLYEDSGINKVGNTYYYSYCTNWSGGPYGNARIAYMTSSNPLGPFTYVDTVFHNPSEFFGISSNNHHTIFQFGDKYYIAYHTLWLNKQTYGEDVGYRTTHIDELPFSGGKFRKATGTLTGVDQLKDLDVTKEVRFNEMAWQGGISVNGLGDTVIGMKKGSWTGVSGAALGDSSKITITAGSAEGCEIRVSVDSPSGTVLGYVTVKSTGDNNKLVEHTGTLTGASGTKNIFFTSSGNCNLGTYKFS